MVAENQRTDLARHALIQMNDGFLTKRKFSPQSVALMQTPQSSGGRSRKTKTAVMVLPWKERTSS